MKIIKIIAIILAVIVVILLCLLIFIPSAKSPTVPASPPAGATSASPDDHAVVTLPSPNSVVASPVAIEGTVIGGGWFFEGSFPIRVLDSSGNVIGSGTAQALNDWTSTGTVPFSASISFAFPPGDAHATGTIVFSKDNPSGDPDNAESLDVPMKFQ